VGRRLPKRLGDLPNARARAHDSYEPIKLKDGRRLDTLDDARAFMLALSERTQLRSYWQYAGELVLKAAESNRASIKDAWAQLRRALLGEGLL
jgi:hypothetical protein